MNKASEKVLEKEAIKYKSHLKAFIEPLFILLLIASAFWFSLQVNDILQNSRFVDFRKAMFRGAEAIAHGQSPYDLEGIRQAPFRAWYKYPPLFAIMLAPFTRFEFSHVVVAWIILNLFLYIAAFILLIRAELISFRSIQFYVLGIVFLTFQPSIDTLTGGQLEILLLLLFVIAYWATCRSRHLNALGACQ